MTDPVRLAALLSRIEVWRKQADQARTNANNRGIPLLDRRQCFGVAQAFEQCADELEAEVTRLTADLLAVRRAQDEQAETP